MVDRTTRLRWRRRLRRSKRQVGDISVQAEEKLEKHLIKRLVKLPGVMRFTLTWLALVFLLIGGLVVQTRALDNYFLQDRAVAGGTYVEGILGAFTNANPLYATGSVDKSVSQLVFAGLLKYDEHNNLVPDLAQSWKVDNNGLNYTISLPKNLTWQDGQPLTADDVVFTYQTIQNPDAQSPLQPGWQGVTFKALNPQTVQLTLPNPLSTFGNFLTTGIIPKHLLQNVPPDQLRSISFNTTDPVGAGPFRWDAIQVDGQTPTNRQEQIALTPFEDYKNGRPKLNKMIIKAFHDKDSMLNAFRNQDLNGMAGLNELPADLANKANINEYNIPLLGEVMVFFKSSTGILKDVKVRQALTMATDRSDIIDGLGYPVVSADEPILKTDLGYNPNFAEAKYNLAAAARLLAADGWQLDSQGILAKKGQQLDFALVTQDSPEYKYVSQKLQDQWSKLGVKLEVKAQTDIQLQESLSNHSYDALLYGVEMGPDPDVFAYWDSSQADIRAQSRTNFSEYSSPIADAALEAGRTRLIPKLRVIKYRPFLQAWQTDAPAVALYQPRYLYLTRGTVFGFIPTSLSSGVDRFANVDNWMIREDKLPR